MQKHLTEVLRFQKLAGIKEEPLEEGWKDLALGAMMTGASLMPGQKAHASTQDQNKIAHAVSHSTSELQFQNFEEFGKYFKKNIEDFQKTNSNEPVKVIIDNVTYIGYIGSSMDQQTSILKSQSKNPNKTASYKTSINVGGKYISLVLTKQ